MAREGERVETVQDRKPSSAEVLAVPPGPLDPTEDEMSQTEAFEDEGAGLAAKE